MKWGKEKFDAVELNTEEPPMVFKAQLFALTGVQPDRQKVMVKGGTLKVLKKQICYRLRLRIRFPHIYLNDIY